MNKAEEEAYERGSRMAWVLMLQQCLKALGIDDQETQHARWIIGEREMAVMALRDLCVNYGDNDWPDDLPLADVIRKHIHRHLE